MLGKIKRLVSTIYSAERKLDAIPEAIRTIPDAINSQTQSIVQPLVSAIRTMPDTLPSHQLALCDLVFALERRDAKHIVQASTHFYSQNFEDAVISEIFSRVGTRSKVFVEIGVESGSECNTRLLLEQGWSGVWIEGDPDHAAAATKRMERFIKAGKLIVVHAMVTPENIQSLIDDALQGREIDFFSLDIDYNNSHAWRAVTSKYRVACLEYNASIPPADRWEVAYDADRSWAGDNQFGASLKVYEDIGRDKGMSLVGCDFHGVNAFFVADEECGDQFLEPFTAEKHFAPPRFHLIGHRGHPPAAT